jgi:hypothetical protein
MEIFVVFIFRRDGHMHPGMNAALISCGFARLQRRSGASTGRNKDVIHAGRLRNELPVQDRRRSTAPLDMYIAICKYIYIAI